MISAVRGPENLPSIPLKNVQQTNKQQQKQKSKKGQRSNKVFITVHTIEWPNRNIGMPVLSAVTWSTCLKTYL